LLRVKRNIREKRNIRKLITQAKFNEYVKEFAEAVRDEIQARIIAEDAIDTGRLFRTVDYDLTGGANKYKISFNQQDYGKFC